MEPEGFNAIIAIYKPDKTIKFSGRVTEFHEGESVMKVSFVMDGQKHTYVGLPYSVVSRKN